MYYVYILESQKDGSYYRGHTDNLERRLTQHNSGEVKSTKSKRPWKLVYYEVYQTRSEAIKREREIKSRKKRAYIEKLIKSKHNPMKLL